MNILTILGALYLTLVAISVCLMTANIIKESIYARFRK